jgi:hypothetical protein
VLLIKTIIQCLLFLLDETFLISYSQRQREAALRAAKGYRFFVTYIKNKA